jgi:hypothetical protein
VERTWFERSDDDMTWTPLGEGSRIAGGWSLGGLDLPTDRNIWIRGRGDARGGTRNGSGSILESVVQIYLADRVFRSGFEP